MLVLVAGYLTLAAGHASAAAVILVVGYCVLFPLESPSRRVLAVTAQSLRCGETP